MSDKLQSFKNEMPPELTSRPELLDIIKIDGRWAQVRGGRSYIKYLDDGSTVPIDWDDFKLIERIHGAVKFIKNQEGFSKEEIANIHWGPEQEQNPALKEEATVFGKFEKK